MPTFTVPTPAAFRFTPTVLSHGWYQLPPFKYDADAGVLTRPHRFRDGTLARLHFRAGDSPNAVEVTVSGGRLTRARQAEAGEVAAACLGLDRDLAPFYQLARRSPGHRWVEKAGAGRMLASPTVWEDVAKTLLTTNTTWTATKQMVARLVTLGDPLTDGDHTFPTPERIAALPLADFHAHVRAGYRSEYLHRLAAGVVAGDHTVEAWRGAEPPADLFHQLKAVRGVGDYAAGSMCRLLGRFEHLGLDSVCRAAFRRLYADKPSGDRDIAAHYEPFGEWAGLALWMDVIKDHAVKAVLKPGK